jgi:hypothetical protein
MTTGVLDPNDGGLDRRAESRMGPVFALKAALEIFILNGKGGAPLVRAMAVEVQKHNLHHLIPAEWDTAILDAFAVDED